MPRSEPEKRRALGQERTLHPAPERVRAAVFVKLPAFFDARDELQVKCEMLRSHFLDGEPVTTVCAAFGYSRQTFYLLRDRLAHRGLAGLRDARPGPVGPRTCTPAVVAFLRAQRADDPTLSMPGLAGPPAAQARGPSAAADRGADRGRWSTKKTLRAVNLSPVRAHASTRDGSAWLEVRPKPNTSGGGPLSWAGTAAEERRARSGSDSRAWPACSHARRPSGRCTV